MSAVLFAVMDQLAAQVWCTEPVEQIADGFVLGYRDCGKCAACKALALYEELDRENPR